MTNRLIKAFFILATLLISSAAYSQSIVYTQGNVSIIQYPDTWQITHGGEILAHGNHVIDVENLAHRRGEYGYLRNAFRGAPSL